ncbi:oxidoreductase [Mycobacterium sp. 852002-51163_SCH5372311]|uniref:oxidoreductase n=1 Tax=Mycobacterium sp. 852002-51163_SCH5372311 TaxID=1834097 RepID=UPI0007FC8F05|nr:oxidoreductase [Mycobacterium sp. 852002-51163_SCH5372311]OBF87263.1 oxidoreductase [Mycobacterium sp. 852002-51163_SCH5372311]
MGLLVETWPESWHRSRLFRLLSLGGYVAFDLPRVVTGLGAVLLLGIATAHGYILASEPLLPGYFVAYAIFMIAGCLAVAGTIVFGRNPGVAQAGWYFGDLLSVVFLGVAVGTRIVSLSGLAALTGRWDFVPVTFALAFAAAFIAVHGSVLVGINVAYPRRQQWSD